MGCDIHPPLLIVQLSVRCLMKTLGGVKMITKWRLSIGEIPVGYRTIFGDRERIPRLSLPPSVMIKGLFWKVFQLTDDHAHVRQGIGTFLELQPHLIVAGQTHSGEPDFH